MRFSAAQIAFLSSVLAHGAVLSVVPLFRPSSAVRTAESEPVRLEFVIVGDEVTSPSREHAVTPVQVAPIAAPAPKSEITGHVSSPSTRERIPDIISAVAAKPAETDSVREIPVAESSELETVLEFPIATNDVASAAATQIQNTGSEVVVSTEASPTGHSEDRSTGPAYRYNPAPRYPRRARAFNQQGEVLIALTVTADGLPENMSVRETCGFEVLDKAALESVKTWRFSPAKQDGHALPSRVEIPIRFKLQP